jgi:hypothetical protein
MVPQVYNRLPRHVRTYEERVTNGAVPIVSARQRAWHAGPACQRRCAWGRASWAEQGTLGLERGF